MRAGATATAPASASATTSPCDRPQVARITGDGPNLATAGDVIRNDGAILLVRLGTDRPTAVASEDLGTPAPAEQPPQASPVPWIVTRYPAVVLEALVVPAEWPDAVSRPGSTTAIDVTGGLVGCEALESDVAIPLLPGSTYVAVVSRSRTGSLHLAGESQAVQVVNGRVQDVDASRRPAKLYDVLSKLIGSTVDELSAALKQ